MPYSFTEIEQDKTRTIGFVFSFLLLFYFLAIFVIALVVKNSLHLSSGQDSQIDTLHFLNFTETFIVFAVAAGFGYGHWLVDHKKLKILLDMVYTDISLLRERFLGKVY